MNYKSGFCGKDSMRDKAMKEFGHEMKGFNMNMPDSNSTPARTNMRLYKKGGKVHGLSKMQIDLFIPSRSKQNHQKAARFEKVAMKNDGGMLLGPNNMNTRIKQANELLGNAVRGNVGIKRGGKVKHHSHRSRHAEGGPIWNLGREWIDAAKNSMNPMRSATGLKRGGRAQDDSKRLLKGEPLRKGFHSEYGLNHGGKTHRVRKFDGGDIVNSALFPSAIVKNLGLKHGGKVHKSEGGPMRGEHPSRHCSYNNYESHMVGEHQIHRKAMGGKAMGGKADGYAIGGVGKIRHKQATADGMPIMRRNRRDR